MKKLAYIFIIAFSLTAFNSCREKTTGEKVEDDIENAADDTGDAIEDAGDDVEDALD